MSDIKTYPVDWENLKVVHSCGEELLPEWYLENGKKVVYAHCRKCSVNVVMQRRPKWVKTSDGYGNSETDFFDPPISLRVK